MTSLLGLKFFKSRKHSSTPAQQQHVTEEKASSSVYGGHSLAANETSKAKASSDQDGCRASSKQKIASTHVKPKKKLGLASDRAPVNRKNFSAVKNVRQDETFTNSEMLPGMEEAYKQFRRLYPEYLSTRVVDEIRAREYAYLNEESGRVCLDYSGYGLFSKWQETWQKASSSFGLSYMSVNLPTHALYGGPDEGTAEYDIKRMVSEFFNIQGSEYTMVFTSSRGSAFKLLGESYPFHVNRKLLSIYDYESDAVKWIEEAAQKRGAEIMSAKFRWPSQRLWATDLKKKITEKQKAKKEPAKGLFVFPVQSRMTGANYSYQWMSQAQEHGWDILLDASVLGPNAMGSLGLCVFQPDFVVSSFFKVYGADPTGFGCLMIKRSMLPRLHSSSVARGVGMVRLVPTSSCPEGQPKGGGLREPVHGSLRYTERRQTSSTRTSAGPSQQFCTARASSSGSKSLLESSGKQARAGSDKLIPSVSYKHSLVRSDPHRDQEIEAGSSTSEKSASFQVVQGFSLNNNLICGLSKTEPGQHSQSSLDEVQKKVHFSDDGEKAVAELGQTDDRQSKGESNPEESRVLAEDSGVSGNESRRAGTLQLDGRQPHVSVSPSTMGHHKDVSAGLFDDEDDKIASMPFYGNGAVEAFGVARKEDEIVCRGLEHAQQLGLSGTNIRVRCLINWLIASMLKLRHPGSPHAHHLVQIYGPKVSYDRGASVAFNLFDWKGNLLQPSLVQRLADRSNISFGITTLNHIQVLKHSSSSSRYSEHLNKVNVCREDLNKFDVSSEKHGGEESVRVAKVPSIEVITISLCFLSNFQDVYRFWAFLANFLDADYVSKEVWLYRSLNQQTVVMAGQGA